MYEALLVDFYGTLVEEDTAPIRSIVSRIAAQGADAGAIAADWARRFAAGCAASYGDAFCTQREIELASLRELLAGHGRDLDAEALSQELFDYWVRPEPIAGAAEFLDALDVPLCIVSNIDSADLEAAIEHLGWRLPRVVTSESCRAYKPRGEPFAAALATLGYCADRVLHVGDSIGSDLRGAAEAGIRSVWVNPGGRSLPRGSGLEP